MYDLREHKELISQLVSEANQNDENWRWSVKSVGKEKARIFWEYLEYCGQKEPYFSIVLENTGDGCWIAAKNEHAREATYTDVLTNRGNGWHSTDVAHCEQPWMSQMWMYSNGFVDLYYCEEVRPACTTS